MWVSRSVIRPSRVPGIRRREIISPFRNNLTVSRMGGEGGGPPAWQEPRHWFKVPLNQSAFRTYAVTSVDSRISWICKARQLRASYSLNLRSRPAWLVRRIRYYIRFNPTTRWILNHERRKGLSHAGSFSFLLSCYVINWNFMIVNLNCTTGRIFVEVKWLLSQYILYSVFFLLKMMDVFIKDDFW